MTREKAANKLSKVRIIFIIIGVIFIAIGFYKCCVYENKNDDGYRYNDERSINAYVGGDAYNYIINGTYFTAYSVLGVGALIIATIAGVGEIFLSVEQNAGVEVEEREGNTIDDIESNLPKM